MVRCSLWPAPLPSAGARRDPARGVAPAEAHAEVGTGRFTHIRRTNETEPRLLSVAGGTPFFGQATSSVSAPGEAATSTRPTPCRLWATLRRIPVGDICPGVRERCLFAGPTATWSGCTTIDGRGRSGTSLPETS
jgi:hypothetical protein